MNNKEVRSNNKACDKEVSKAVFKHYSGVNFFKCPSNFYQESYAQWFDLLRHYQNGNISFDLDDPNINYDAIHFTESLQNHYQNEKMREANGR
jgi:hypothetical protein